MAAGEPPLISRSEPRGSLDRGVIRISLLATLLGIVAAFVARLLGATIASITQLVFYGRISTDWVEPTHHRLGPVVILVPVIGSLVVGLMARYGSSAIRGHGIPEAMEKVLFDRSRISPSMTIWKPLSAAVAIGTGGPFGAEGPIIATGGSLGSMVGQLFSCTADERKTLLASGAAAGMTATFGAPVSAVLLAIELLLFEYRPRSVIPVSLAAVAAASIRVMGQGSSPVFPIEGVLEPRGHAMVFYVLIGALAGLAALGSTKLVYWLEDGFERLPFHFMWWPAIGGLVVGVVGYFVPQSLGVGYQNIIDLLSARLDATAILVLLVAKGVSWSVALSSGTSGGTLAPLFTIGSCLGSLLGLLAARHLPGLGIDPRIAALVAMAAIFAGASRALLASVVFAFETTRQPHGLLPLLAGCSAAYLVVGLTSKHSIMTEKIARRDRLVHSDYAIDPLSLANVLAFASRALWTVPADGTVADVRAALDAQADVSHQGFPVVDAQGRTVGVVTRRELAGADPASRVGELVSRAAVFVDTNASLRDAADAMLIHGVGRVLVVDSERSGVPIGIVTRSDLLAAHHDRISAQATVEVGGIHRLGRLVRSAFLP